MESCLIVLLLACAVSSPNDGETVDTRNLLAMKESSKPEMDSTKTVCPQAARKPCAAGLTSSSSDLQLSVEADLRSARLTRLGWDTEGTGRAGINLLKTPIELRIATSRCTLKGTVTPPDNSDVLAEHETRIRHVGAFRP